MSAIGLVAKNTLRQTVRQRLFVNVIVFGVGLLLLAMVVSNLTFGRSDRVVRSIGLSGVTIAVDLMALFVAVSLIHQDIAEKTLFVMLARPMRRWQYVVGRFVGLFAVLAIALVGFSVVFAGTLIVAKGSLHSQDFVALGMVLPEAAVLSAVGLVLSSFSTPTLGGGIGLGVWLACASVDNIVALTHKADEFTKGVAHVVSIILPNFSRFSFREQAVYALDIDSSLVLGNLGYGVVYASALVVLASIILTRREMV